MNFPQANNKNYAIIEIYQGNKCLKLYTEDWKIISKCPELDYDNSGLYSKYYKSGYVRMFHKNVQLHDYWHQLKSWIEYKLNN